nr:Na+/H+ antiporter NhaC family protein [Alteromonas sp. CNT1-28]
MSVATGTSWGTVGTMGVVLMGIGAAMNIPLPIVAGMVICGATFGDKMSPVSDTTNLASMSAGTNLY